MDILLGGGGNPLSYNLSQLARGRCKTSTQFPRNISFDPETYAQTIFKSVENEII